MKKLIINQKNLPKIGKTSDSNIRIRINKSQNAHDSTGVQKSVPVTIQEIDLCVETLQKFNNGTSLLDDEHTFLIIQLLKQYKQILNPNSELMTQSLKFSKLKFKTIGELEEKQNAPPSSKTQKNPKELLASDRITRLTEKSQYAGKDKSQKNRKIVSMYKKTPERLATITDDSQRSETNLESTSKKQNEPPQPQEIRSTSDVKNEESKTQEQAGENLDESIEFNEPTLPAQIPQVKFLQEQVINLTHTVRQKTEEIEELQERIQQLGDNVQNLIKKNSQKSEEFNKLHEQNMELMEKVNALSSQTGQNQDLQLFKTKCQQMEEENRNLLKKKEELQKKLKKFEKEKEEVIEQELGRYETAQHFYEIARKDLSKENENLISLLEERQRQLANLYQVISLHSNFSFMKTTEEIAA